MVRGIDLIDETNRVVWFHASGVYPDQDPYFIHYARVNFDGSGLVFLTAGNGTHSISYSPDRRYLIDTWSRVDLPPVNELRRAADGKLVCALEEADITELKASGWEPPEVFVSKGRDGQTDIWGIICRPRNLDPNQEISHHRGNLRRSAERLCAQGVQRVFALRIADAARVCGGEDRRHGHRPSFQGLPRRLLAQPQGWRISRSHSVDESRRGKVSLPGHHARGGLRHLRRADRTPPARCLFHPEFYKAAVANCGCHDNRMDKASWNEQWMGYPVGPHYAECSNIENAARLRGHLFLIVGEMDDNVPPESTYRFVDALIKGGQGFRPARGARRRPRLGRRLCGAPARGFFRAAPAGSRAAQPQCSEYSVKLIAMKLLSHFLILAAALSSPVSNPRGCRRDRPPVTAPPESFFAMVRERDRDAARQFYRKHIDVQGMPVVAPAKWRIWPCSARIEIVSHMLAGRPDIIEAMVKNRMYLIVIGKDQVYTDMPEYRNHPEPGLSERAGARHRRPAHQLRRGEPAQPAARPLRRREHRRA